MPSSCVITFYENPDGVYFCGQKISGKILLTTDKLKAIRGIYVAVRGFTDVRWSETRSGTVARRMYFRGHDEYFVSRTELMSSRNTSRFDLLPGKYEFDFKFHLPYILPSSFIGKYGQIRYEVVLTIDRPWRFDNVFKQPFTVICPLDLNSNPMYKQPVNKAAKKHFAEFLCCGNGGEIVMTGHMPHGGFAPGQHIPVDIIVKNFSTTHCQEVVVKLVKVVEYRSTSPHCKRKYDTVTMAERRFGPVENAQEKSLNCCLRVPPVPPTTLQGCKIIDLSYFVDIYLKTSGFHSSMSTRLPVTIGTVPLFYGGQLTSQFISSQPTKAVSKQGVIFTIPAPPSYEEATHIDADFMNDTDENHHMQPVEFIPKYPVYYEFDDIILTRKICSRHHHPLNEIKQRY